jgi:hypothetical protein
MNFNKRCELDLNTVLQGRFERHRWAADGDFDLKGRNPGGANLGMCLEHKCGGITNRSMGHVSLRQDRGTREAVAPNPAALR